jgi:hypothetical protein
MKPYFLSVFVLAGAILLTGPEGLLLAEPVDVVRDSDSMPLFPGLEAASTGKDEEGNKKDSKWETVDIKLTRISPVSGNNPFDPDEPVKNFDGSNCGTIEGIERIAAGQSCGGSGSTSCNPSTATAVVTAHLWAQGIYYTMDSAAGECKVTVDVFFPNSAFWVGQTSVLASPDKLNIHASHPAVCRITQFPAGCSGSYSCDLAPGTYDLELLEVATGRKFRLNITFTGNGTDPYGFFNYASFTVTINSVIPLN